MKASFSINKEKGRSMSISKRIHAGKWLTCVEAGIYASAHIALLVATAAFLWHPVESKSKEGDDNRYGKVCNEPYEVVEQSPYNSVKYSSACTNTVNVYDRFTTILQLYFAFFVIQFFRMATIFVALCTSSAKVAKIFDGLGCGQCCYGLACLIILHVYRFQPSGKLAGLDYMSMDQRKEIMKAYKEEWDKTGEMPESGQILRATYLLGLVVYIWVGGFVLCCIQCCVAAIHVKKYGPAPE